MLALYACEGYLDIFLWPVFMSFLSHFHWEMSQYGLLRAMKPGKKPTIHIKPILIYSGTSTNGHLPTTASSL